ncbi:MAG: hypothetical protein V7603_1257, partial [Micromonosporaceae bacterium]
MPDAEDVLDGVLQTILDFFHELDHWVPMSGTVLSWFIDIPEGKEKKLYELADAYTRASQLYASHLNDISPYQKDLAVWTGDGAAQAAHESLQHYVQHVSNMIDAFGGASEVVHGAALGIETTKWSDAVNLIFLAVSAVVAIVSAFFTFGASLAEVGGAMAVCRTAIMLAAKQLLEKLMEGITKKVIIAAVIRGAQFMAFTLLSDIVAWTMEGIEGHKPHIDGWELGRQMFDSFAVGFFGGLITKGAHGPFAEAFSMGSGQLTLNALEIAANDAFDKFGLHKWATDHNLYTAGADGKGPGLFDGVLQSATVGAAFGLLGAKENIKDAIGKLRLDQGLSDLGLKDFGTKTATGDAPALSPDLAPKTETGSGLGDSSVHANDPGSTRGAGITGTGGAGDHATGATGSGGAGDHATGTAAPKGEVQTGGGSTAPGGEVKAGGGSAAPGGEAPPQAVHTEVKAGSGGGDTVGTQAGQPASGEGVHDITRGEGQRGGEVPGEVGRSGEHTGNGENRPTEGEPAGVAGDQSQVAGGGERPTTTGDRPSATGDRPSASGDRTSTGGERSSTSGDRSSSGGDRSS